MKSCLIVACVIMLQVTCGLAATFALHILNDPMNTGYFHLGAVAFLPVIGAVVGYAFPRS